MGSQDTPNFELTVRTIAFVLFGSLREAALRSMAAVDGNALLTLS